MKYIKNNDFKPPNSKKKAKEDNPYKFRAWPELRHLFIWRTPTGRRYTIAGMDTNHIIRIYAKLSNWSHNRMWGECNTSQWLELFHKELRYRNFILNDIIAENWWETRPHGI